MSRSQVALNNRYNYNSQDDLISVKYLEELEL